MTRDVKLNDLDRLLDEFEYPATKERIVSETGDVRLQLADGTEWLDKVVESSSEDTFDSVDELQNEVMSLLPRHAVGEPFQSEGDG